MASWYTEGTVTVTNGSTVVAGTGTKFSNCRSGDMFVGPDGAIYQVINAPSDTSVSINPAYRGANAAGAVYAIVPVNGYPKALADAVNQMVQQWGATLAGLGPVASMTVVPVANGGTGALNAVTARTNLGLGSAAVLNTGNAAGNVMTVGTGGLYGPPSAAPYMTNMYNMTGRSFEMGQYAPVSGANAPGAVSPYGVAVGIQGANAEWRHILQFTTDGDVYDVSITNPSSGGQWRVAKFYTTLNTTRAADGTLKAI